MWAKLLVMLGVSMSGAFAGLYDGLGLAGGLGHGGGLALAGGLGHGGGLALAGGLGHGGGLALAGGLGHGDGLALGGGLGHATVLAHAAPAVAVTKVAAAKQVVDYVDAHPAYQFNYGVHDAHTGDVKEQTEHRDGDVVHGSYSLIEPDGTKRIVEYTADDHNGFNAIVHREHNAHPQVLQKVAVAAPVVKAAPLLSHY